MAPPLLSNCDPSRSSGGDRFRASSNKQAHGRSNDEQV